MIIACLLLNFLQQNCENRLLNKVFMIGRMTCSCAPTAGGTTAQFGTKHAAAPPQTRSHQPNTAYRH